MKNLGCIVPVSFIVLVCFLLAGCATPFGTRDDPTPAAQYLNKHQPRHVVYKAPSAGRELSVDSKGEPAPLVVEKKKKKGFWARVRSHLSFKKKED